MKKFILILSLFAMLACTDESDDPFLNLDGALRLETISFVVPTIYELFLDRNLRWGVPWTINYVEPISGGNVLEMEVAFTGGCARHRFAFYAESVYEDRLNPEVPLDITIYAFHSQTEENCSESQVHVLRQVDLSFLSPGLYNITLENTFDRAQYSINNYEVR